PDTARSCRLCQPEDRHHRKGDQGARRQVAAEKRPTGPGAPAAVASHRRPPVSPSLSELAQLVGAVVDGDGSVRVSHVATLESAGPGTIAFLARAKYRKQLATTGAAAVILAPGMAGETPLPKLVSANPYATFAKVATILHPAQAAPPGR